MQPPHPAASMLDLAVEQLLFGKLEGLDARGTAAFVIGWSSALDLARRTELTLPDEPVQVRLAVERAVAAIEDARRRVLGGDE